MTASFHKVDQKAFNGIISGLYFTTFVNMRVKMIYKLVTYVIPYFSFPDRAMKGGDISDF